MKQRDEFFPQHLQVPEDQHDPHESSWLKVQKEKQEANKREAEENETEQEGTNES